MSNTYTIIVFLLAIVYLMGTIVKFKMHAFFSMITCCFLVGFAMQMNLTELVNTITAGFGGMMTSLGIVIILGAILGSVLSESGATEVLADAILKIAGQKKSSLAMNIIGFIVSIPVYMGSAYIILDPINRTLARKTKKNVLVYCTSLSIGLLVTHCLVIPTPGPLAVASGLGLNIGVFIFYSIIVAIPASLAGGWLWGEFLGKKYGYEEPWSPEDKNGAAAPAVERADADRPSAALAAGLIFLPIVIILVGSCLGMAASEGILHEISTFLTAGSGVAALLVSTILALFSLRKYIDMPLSRLIPKTLDEQGSILVILGAGGCFGGVIKATGIGDVLVSVLSSLNISVIVLAFILCILLRAALGSSTVALVTTISILGPVASEMGANMTLMGLAICAAAIGLSLPTDGGYWEIQSLDNLSISKTTWSMTGGSTIASVVGFAMVMLLSACSGFLPGLH